MPEKGYKPKYPVQTLEKAIDVLLYLKANSSPMGVGIAAISEDLGMGKSSIHRILDTLYAYGFVEKAQQGTGYCLGWGLYDIAQAVPGNHNLSETNYRSYLEDLCNMFSETVNLGILSNGEVVIVCKNEPERRLRSRSEVGEREPLYCTALGKQFLMEFTEEEKEKHFAAIPMEKLTEHTITSLAEINAELEKVRKQGYSMDYMEYCEDLICIAAPIRDFTKKVVAAISVSLPENRYTKDKGEKIIEQLQKKTAELSSFLGY